MKTLVDPDEPGRSVVLSERLLREGMWTGVLLGLADFLPPPPQNVARPDSLALRVAGDVAARLVAFLSKESRRREQWRDVAGDAGLNAKVTAAWLQTSDVNAQN